MHKVFFNKLCKNRLASCLMVTGALLLVANPVHAEQTMLELAQKKTCLGCHQVDKKRVGPGFQQVSERYKGQAEAEPHLVEVILKGGRGNWGAIPMPAQTRVSPEQAKQLAQWILSLSPKQ
jgi:cytochrome c